MYGHTEWRAPEAQIRAALAWEPDPPAAPRNPDQEAELMLQGYLEHGVDYSPARARARQLAQEDHERRTLATVTGASVPGHLPHGIAP